MSRILCALITHYLIKVHFIWEYTICVINVTSIIQYSHNTQNYASLLELNTVERKNCVYFNLDIDLFHLKIFRRLFDFDYFEYINRKWKWRSKQIGNVREIRAVHSMVISHVRPRQFIWFHFKNENDLLRIPLSRWLYLANTKYFKLSDRMSSGELRANSYLLSWKW